MLISYILFLFGFIAASLTTGIALAILYVIICLILGKSYE